jgi:GTP-binding protein HflX
MNGLLDHMAELASGGSRVCTLELPAAAGGRLAKLHRAAQVLETHYEGDRVRLVAVLSPALLRDYQDCMQPPES